MSERKSEQLLDFLLKNVPEELAKDLVIIGIIAVDDNGLGDFDYAASGISPEKAKEGVINMAKVLANPRKPTHATEDKGN